MCACTQAYQGASKYQIMCCILGPYCPHLLQWLKIWGWIYLAIRICADHELVYFRKMRALLGMWPSISKHNPAQSGGTTCNSSEKATQRVAYVTQGHWNCKRLKNTVRSPSSQKLRQSGLLRANLHVEGFATENDAGRIPVLCAQWKIQALGPAEEDYKYSSTPLFWGAAFQQKTFGLSGQT